MMFLLGRQATFGHAPPTYFRSIEAVRLPSLAIVQAINLPAVPLPSTRTSYLSGSLMLFISFLSSTTWDKKLFAAIKPRLSRRGSLAFLPRTRERLNLIEASVNRCVESCFLPHRVRHRTNAHRRAP